jgi:hypothetical protein
LWDDTKRQCPELLSFDVDGERVLQVLALWDAKINNRPQDPTRSVLLSINKEFISQNWQVAAESLSDAYKWARENGATPKNLPNHGVLAVIAAFNIVCDEFTKKPISTWQPVLKRWYFSKVLETGAKQASNYRIGKDFSMLVKYAEDNIPLDFPIIQLSIERLIKISKPSDTRYKSLQCIMATTANADLLSGVKLDDNLEDHHIFPRSLYKKYGIPLEDLDSIVNRIIVSKSTNQTLSDKLPSEYFNDLKESAMSSGIVSATDKRLQDCLIPGSIESPNFVEQFEREKFKEFLRNRSEIILKKVEQVIGESLKSTNDTDEDLDLD